MSEIKNGRLGLCGAEHSKCNHMMTLGFKGLKSCWPLSCRSTAYEISVSSKTVNSACRPTSAKSLRPASFIEEDCSNFVTWSQTVSDSGSYRQLLYCSGSTTATRSLDCPSSLLHHCMECGMRLKVTWLTFSMRPREVTPAMSALASDPSTDTIHTQYIDVW